MRVGGRWDGGCWGEERKGEMVRVGEMQQGERVHRGWGRGAGNSGDLGAKEPFGDEFREEVEAGALGKAGGSQEKGVGPHGWHGMGEGTLKGWGMHPWSRWGSGCGDEEG